MRQSFHLRTISTRSSCVNLGRSLQSGPRWRALLKQGLENIPVLKVGVPYAFAIRNAVGLNFCTSGWLHSNQSKPDEHRGRFAYRWHAKTPHISKCLEGSSENNRRNQWWINCKVCLLTADNFSCERNRQRCESSTLR